MKGINKLIQEIECCPSQFELMDATDCGKKDCEECWREALEKDYED